MSSFASFTSPELDYGDTNPRVISFPPVTSAFPIELTERLRPPGSEAWRVLSVFHAFAASGVVGNRTFELDILDADLNQFYTASQSIVCTAGQAVSIVYSIASSQVATAANVGTAPLLDFVLLPSWSILINVDGMQAGDLFADCSAYIIEISTTPSHSQPGNLLDATPIVL